MVGKHFPQIARFLCFHKPSSVLTAYVEVCILGVVMNPERRYTMLGYIPVRGLMGTGNTLAQTDLPLREALAEGKKSCDGGPNHAVSIWRVARFCSGSVVLAYRHCYFVSEPR